MHVIDLTACGIGVREAVALIQTLPDGELAGIRTVALSVDPVTATSAVAALLTHGHRVDAVACYRRLCGREG